MRGNFFRRRDSKKLKDLHQKLLENNHLSTNDKLPSTELQTNVFTKLPNADRNQHANAVTKETQWDFCIVIPNPEFIEKGETEPRKVNMHYREILERLLIGGLDTYQFYSGDGDEIFIKGEWYLYRFEKLKLN